MKLMPLVLVVAGFLGLATLIAACSTTNTIACGTGSVDCSGTCTVLSRDPENCGTCGTKCPSGQACVAGMCAANACPTGTTKCGDACVATGSDPVNCGACGTKCAANEVCSTGKCANTCAMGLTQCGQSCIDTKTDSANCGMCGMACPMGQTCSNGACGFSCMQGLTLCNSTQMNPPPVPDGGEAGAPYDGGPGAPICVDLQNNDRHCGACGNFCYGNQKCNKGKCDTCLLCGGNCIDTSNDDNNCNGCGKTCAYDGGSTSCKNNYCCKQKITKIYLQDDFRDATKNWTLDTQWAIGPAKASTSCTGVGQDPAFDHTNRGDNGIAGVVIGGCTGISMLHGYYYMTSPQFDSSAATKVVVSFWRHLHADYSSYQSHRVEVYDGNAWQVVYQNPNSSTNDANWVHVAYDVTQYKNATMQIRFGYNQVLITNGPYDSASWNVDDVLVADEDCAP